MSVTGYDGCDCDKYNPYCRCYPRKEEPVANEPHTNALREAVARAIANYDDAKYAKRDGWEPGINTYDAEPEFREDYLKQADAAIAAVLDHLIAEAGQSFHLSRANRSIYGRDIAEWLRSFREAGK